MKQKRAPPQIAKQSQKPENRPINARFESRLPDIVEEICRALMVIEPAIRDMEVQLREFSDYLSFEIEKLKVRIALEEWEAKVDPDKLQADRDWLSRLEALQSDFTIDVVTSGPNQVRQLLERVRETF